MNNPPPIVSSLKIKAPALAIIILNAISLASSTYNLSRFVTMNFNIPHQPFHGTFYLVFILITIALSACMIVGSIFMLRNEHYHFTTSVIILSLLFSILAPLQIYLSKFIPLFSLYGHVAPFTSLSLATRYILIPFYWSQRFLYIPILIFTLFALHRQCKIALQFDSKVQAVNNTVRVLKCVVLSIIALLGLAAACGYSAAIVFFVGMGSVGDGGGGGPSAFLVFLSCSPVISFLLVSLSCLPIISFQKIKFTAGISFLLMIPLLIEAIVAGQGFPRAGINAIISTAVAFFIIYFTRQRPQIERSSMTNAKTPQ